MTRRRRSRRGHPSIVDTGEIPECPYCQKPSVMVGGDVIYPRRKDLKHKRFWLCAGCRAYVGCHPGTSVPFGRLANAMLRQAKMDVHAAFDHFWRDGEYTRDGAYAELARRLRLTPEECHIGLFNIEMCADAIQACEEWESGAGLKPESEVARETRILLQESIIKR